MHLCFLLVVFLTLANTVNSQDEEAIVAVSEGLVRGRVDQTLTGRNYYAFLGIPYAAKPRRFQAPEAPVPWEGIRNATDFGLMCAQGLTVGGENCLFLNVFTPQLPQSPLAELPVLVYIHGGSFQTGGTDNYGPKFFLEENVVLVTLNYRLGALGFLTTGGLDNLTSANNGLKDQTMALRWVQENIGAFSGDKSRVTIFGESAGGASVSYHMISPLSKGLFHRGISKSGSCLSPWALSRNPLEAATQLGQKLDCPNSSTQELIRCLESKDFRDILLHQEPRKWGGDPIATFGPVVEQDSPTAFLPDSPYKLLNEGKFDKLPWILGITEEEGMLLQAAVALNSSELLEDLNQNWNHVAPITFLYDELIPEGSARDNISAQIRQFYFGEEEIRFETRMKLANAYSDRWFNGPVETEAVLRVKHQVPTYLYRFTYQGEQSFLDYLYPNLGELGVVSHGDDEQYLFQLSFFDQFEVGSTSYNISRNWVRLWVSFAETGVPSATWGSAAEWPALAMEEEERTWYELNVDTSLWTSTMTERLQFWNNLLPLSLTPNSYF